MSEDRNAAGYQERDAGATTPGYLGSLNLCFLFFLSYSFLICVLFSVQLPAEHVTSLAAVPRNINVATSESWRYSSRGKKTNKKKARKQAYKEEKGEMEMCVTVMFFFVFFFLSFIF